MAIPPIILNIQANSSGVSSVFGGITRNINQATNALQAAQERTRELEDAVREAQRNGDMQALATSSAALANHLNSAQGQAAALGSKLDTLKAAGIGIGAAGAAGLVLAQNLIEAQKEGTALDFRLQSILRTQGRLNDLSRIQSSVSQTTEEGGFASSSDLQKAATYLASVKVETDDIIKALPRLAAVARSADKDIMEMAENWAEGYRNLSFEDLEEAGLFLGDANKKKIDDLKESAGMAAARVEFMSLFLKEADGQAGSLATSISDTERASNDAERAVSKLQSAVGRGAAEARKSYDEMLGSVLKVVGANEEAAESAGGWLVIGSTVAMVGGTILTVFAQIGSILTATTMTFGSLWAAIVAGAGTAATAIAGLIAPITAVALAIGGLWVAWKGGQDAATMSDQALRDKWLLGDFWVKASGSDQDTGPTAEDRAAFEQAKRSGLTRGKTFEQWRGSSIDNTPSPTVDPVEKAKKDVADAMKTAQASVDASRSGGLSGLAGISGATAGTPSATAPRLGGLLAESDAAQDKKVREEKAKKEAEEQKKKDAQLAIARASILAARLDEQSGGISAEGDLADSRDRSSLLAQIRTIKGQAKSGVFSEDEARLRIEALRNLYDARNAARDADMRQQLAEVEAQKVLAEANARASSQEGELRDATLQVAESKARQLRAVAAAKAQADREEAREAEREAQEKLREVQEQKRGTNTLGAMFAARRLAGSYSGGADGLATANGRPFGMRGGNYGDGPAFLGTGAQRLRDAARSASAVQYQGQASGGREDRVRLNFRQIATEVISDLLGRQEFLIRVQAETGGNVNQARGGIR